MTNQELMSAMQASARLIVGHVGDSVPRVKTSHADLKIGDVVYIDNYENGKFPKANPRTSGPFTKVIGNGCGRYFEDSKGRGFMHYPENMIVTDSSVPKKTPVLKSRRFAMVIDNELHIRKYEDPAHGWLAVPMQWLEALGIVGKISAFSFRRNSTAYLEEDGDMSEFIGAAKRAGFQIFIDCHHTYKFSQVRSYPTYHTAGFTVEPNFSEALYQSEQNEVFRTTLEGF